MQPSALTTPSHRHLPDGRRGRGRERRRRCQNRRQPEVPAAAGSRAEKSGADRPSMSVPGAHTRVLGPGSAKSGQIVRQKYADKGVVMRVLDTPLYKNTPEKELWPLVQDMAMITLYGHDNMVAITFGQGSTRTNTHKTRHT